MWLLFINRNLSDRVTELNNKTDGKWGKTDQLWVTGTIPVTADAFTKAPIVVNAATAHGQPAIGFHSPNKEGAALYLQDGNLFLILSNGSMFRLDMTFVGGV